MAPFGLEDDLDDDIDEDDADFDDEDGDPDEEDEDEEEIETWQVLGACPRKGEHAPGSPFRHDSDGLLELPLNAGCHLTSGLELPRLAPIYQLS